MRPNNASGRSNGVTLIELLIVITVIGIPIAVLVVICERRIRQSDELAAIAIVEHIKVAESKYFIRHERYGTFRQLTDEGYLDERFNSERPVISGYIFVLRLVDKGEGHESSLQLNANPKGFEAGCAKGKTFFYTESQGMVFVKVGEPASVNDELLSNYLERMSR